MAHPKSILEEISDQYGLEWNEHSMLCIATDYIETLMDNGKFRAYVEERAKEETGEV